MSNTICNNNLKVPTFYAGFSRDAENLESSSSGGIFYELCKYVISKQGVVYGAAQVSITDVRHMRAASLEETQKFRRSKYLKSKMDGCFIRAKEDLEQEKVVLFSGLPCQIAALYRYLDKDYENLYTAEVVCHGMPLSSVFKKYVSEKSAGIHGKLVNICFRDKSQGWKNNSIREYYEDGYEYVVSSSKHPVHSLYIKGINMEEKCASCEYAKLPRVADITLADFWQYKGELIDKNDDKGMSLMAINNDKGNLLLERIQDSIYCEKVSQEEALNSCRHMSHSPLLGKSHRAFKHMLSHMNVTLALDICSKFGDIVLAEELCTMTKTDEAYVMNVLQEDTQEIIYVVDEARVLKGIVTFGAFVQAYLKGENWVNCNFGKVVLSENCIEDIQEVLRRSEKILRVPVVDNSGKLLFEVRRTCGGNGKNDVRKGMIPFIALHKANIPCIFVQRPDYIQDYDYNETQKKHIENKWSFPKLSEDIKANEDTFKEILGNKYSVEYVEGLCKISPIFKKGNRYVHADTATEYVNVVGGVRRTQNQPEEYVRTVHVYGRCGVFGYAVEDAHTMPSRLQELLKDKKIRVVNHGTWGADDTKILANLYWDIKEQIIAEEDMVLIYMRFLPYMDTLQQLAVKCFDTTKEYYQYLNDGGMFYDIPGHMTAEGYEYIAQCIHNYMRDIIEEYREEKKKIKVTKELSLQSNLDNSDEIQSYIKRIKGMLPEHDFMKLKVGSIVMNCNPFTKGHKYLIETARKEVDILLIFVLEEDKSYFSFKDRIEMVKLGTAEMENVYVLPSGKFMISALTFPEYFLKEQQQEVVINPAKDVEIFGKYIAPEFNISIRFVGTEPLDKVTNQYNQSLKKILPEYGIRLNEVKRLETVKGYVSATTVRKSIEENKEDTLKLLIPMTTLDYLKEKQYL